MAPTRIADSRLCFEVLCGQIDWVVPPHRIPMKEIPKRDTCVGLNSMVDLMLQFLRESTCEQGLYPRVACILLEMVNLYKDLTPVGMNIVVHPLMPFSGTDKSTYAVVVVSVISF